MYAIRARRKTVTEKDFLDAVNKVIKGELVLFSRIITDLLIACFALGQGISGCGQQDHQG